MAKKNKIRKLTDEQYNAYIATLKDDPALYSPKGEFVPDEIKPDDLVE
jgi:hypothetical protein